MSGTDRCPAGVATDAPLAERGAPLPGRPSFQRRFEPGTTCPSCGGAGMLTFFGLIGIPVHSCRLMPTREDAVGCRRGDLQLGYCRACGFIANTAFDASVHEYSTRYEETQAFSSTFNAFARSLAARLVAAHDLRGRTVLEIGCGKGEFLVLLCELGGNRGIGIDPSYIPERTTSPAATRIRFIRDFYSEKYAELEADFVCCRHTLEHIGPTGPFVRLVRAALGERGHVPVLFEVPDVLRVLREGAFWDIYYEHCSYFSAGSLARLVRACRFDVADLTVEFGGQYVVLTAMPADRPTTPALPLERDLGDLDRAVDAFGAVAAAAVNRWRTALDGLRERGRRPVVWGSGSKGVAFLTTLGMTDGIEYVVDINPHKHGRFMPGTGQEIVAPEFLVGYGPTDVLVMNPIYTEEIRQNLARLGLAPMLLPM
jgi:SAM-dependent methyltransferase